MSSPVPVPRRRRRRWPWIVAVLVVLGAGASGVILSRGRGNGATKGLRSEDIDLRLGTAAVADVQISVHEVGTIEPVVEVDVKSTLSGKVTDLLVREGDRVTRGQVLARVEPDVNQAQELSAVKSGLRLAEIRIADANKDMETHQRLHDEGYLSEQELKNTRVKLDTAIEELAAAKTRIRIVEESGIPIDQEISTTQRVNIVAPMDGYVIGKNVEVGQTVTSGVSSFNEGTVLYTVADLRSMLIEAAINEVDIGRVRLGQPVTITVDAFPFKRFAGAVTHISPAARLQEKIKVFDIEVTLDEQVAEFRAGMTANIEIRGDRADQVLAVPVEGIFKREGRDVVYLLKETFEEPEPGAKAPRKTRSGKYDVSDVWQRYFEEREIDVGLASLEKVQVVAGLVAGDELALEDPVKPREIEED
jgi:RND family efflux transporter MFP subunit